MFSLKSSVPASPFFWRPRRIRLHSEQLAGLRVRDALVKKGPSSPTRKIKKLFSFREIHASHRRTDSTWCKLSMIYTYVVQILFRVVVRCRNLALKHFHFHFVACSQLSKAYHFSAPCTVWRPDKDQLPTACKGCYWLYSI
jgi:hypothetical protein